jgi:protein transport protein SEC31
MRFLRLLSSGALREIVESVAPAHWRAALAAICTYAKEDAFPMLASLLGDRLCDAGDMESASLCYIVAGNVQRVVTTWIADQQRHEPSSG